MARNEPTDDAVQTTYSSDYLRACADDEARQERLAELKRRIEHGAYRIDPLWIADHFLSRERDPDL